MPALGKRRSTADTSARETSRRRLGSEEQLAAVPEESAILEGGDVTTQFSIELIAPRANEAALPLTEISSALGQGETTSVLSALVADVAPASMGSAASASAAIKAPASILVQWSAPVPDEDVMVPEPPMIATDPTPQQKTELSSTFDAIISRKGFADLHSHLMGMGGPSFWTSRILEELLPRILNRRVYMRLATRPSTKNIIAVLKERVASPQQKGMFKPDKFKLARAIEMAAAAPTGLGKDALTSLSKSISSETTVLLDTPLIAFLNPPPGATEKARIEHAEIKFSKHYSADVVYSFESLCTASDLPYPKDEFTRSMSLSKLESRLQPDFELSLEEAAELKAAFQQSTYIVYNFRKQMFQLVSGLQNGLLARLLVKERENTRELPGPMRGMVHNWFSMLDTDGSAASASHIRGVFRGCFTPEFYPMRFIIKDSMYEQQPVVLAVLLNHVAGRYDKAGVSAAELSISSSDVVSPFYLDVLNKWTFNTELLPTLRKPKPSANPPITEESHEAAEEEVEDEDEEAAEEVEVQAGAGAPKPKRTGTGPFRGELFKPWWRVHTTCYIEKPPRLMMRLLCAFSRTKDLVLPVGMPEGSEALRVTFPKASEAASPIECMRALGELVKLALRVWPATAGSDGARHTAVVESVLARALSTDAALEGLYPDFAAQMAKSKVAVKNWLNSFNKEGTADHYSCNLARLVVGFDWVADELGVPYCALAHSGMSSVLAKLRQVTNNDLAGIRYHSGENVLRPSDAMTPATTDPMLDYAFQLHVYISMQNIYKLHGITAVPSAAAIPPIEVPSAASDVIKPRFRIGHGVAFLFGPEAPPRYASLAAAVQKLRKFLRDNHIVCELNPTSNHMLLSDSHASSNQKKNSRTLPTFLNLKVPVIICTDNDGIWELHPCPSHSLHAGLAREFCDCLERKEIKSKVKLEEVVKSASDAKFFDFT